MLLRLPNGVVHMLWLWQKWCPCHVWKPYWGVIFAMWMGLHFNRELNARLSVAVQYSLSKSLYGCKKSSITSWKPVLLSEIKSTMDHHFLDRSKGCNPCEQTLTVEYCSCLHNRPHSPQRPLGFKRLLISLLMILKRTFHFSSILCFYACLQWGNSALFSTKHHRAAMTGVLFTSSCQFPRAKADV